MGSNPTDVTIEQTKIYDMSGQQGKTNEHNQKTAIRYCRLLYSGNQPGRGDLWVQSIETSLAAAHQTEEQA